MEINRKKGTALFLVFILVIIIIGAGTWHVSKSAFEGSQESLPWYAGAPFPYSYIIDSNSTHYFAYNGTTGYLQFSGTNASQTINNAINSGDSICLVSALYEIDVSIAMDSGTYLFSMGQAIIQPKANFPTYDGFDSPTSAKIAIRNKDATGNNNITVKGITIDCSKNPEPLACQGIRLHKSTDIRVEDVDVLHPSSGIALSDCEDFDISHNYIYEASVNAIDMWWATRYGVVCNNLIVGSGSSGTGIVVTGLTSNNDPVVSQYVSIVANEIHGTTQGIWLQGGVIGANVGTTQYCTVQGNIITDLSSGGYHGIRCSEGKGHIIKGNILGNIPRDGIILLGEDTGAGASDDCEIIGNQIFSVSQEADNSYYGISLYAEADNNLVAYNHVRGSNHHTSIIVIYANCTDNTITYNDIDAGMTGTIVDYGTGTTVRGNKGYVTENSGTSSSVSNGDWQAHGLMGTPTTVILTPHSNVNVWCNARNTTHFQFGVASGTPDIDWYAEYAP